MLVQYITPEGEQRVSYVQFLRPIVMVPAQPYQPAQPITLQTRKPLRTTTPSPSQDFSYFSSGEEQPSYAAPLTASSNLFAQAPTSSVPVEHSRRLPFVHHRQQHELDLNMNEFLPSATSQSFAAVLPPSTYPQPFHNQRIQHNAIPTFRRFAQRA